MLNALHIVITQANLNQTNVWQDVENPLKDGKTLFKFHSTCALKLARSLFLPRKGIYFTYRFAYVVSVDVVSGSTWILLYSLVFSFKHSLPHAFISKHRYHIPRSFFKPSGNTLVIFEERGGDPTKITFAKRRETTICSFISEDHPQLDLENWDVKGKDNAVGALMNLKCPEGTSISSIIFASFGNPSGTCSSYRQGSCHCSNSISVVEKVNFRLWSSLMNKDLSLVLLG